MNSLRFWLRILNVYPEEWWIVKRLYLLQFFQGAGIAFFFTSAFAQFLDKFPITQLPWVMISSAVLLWVTGYLYAKLEHALTFKQFNIGTLIFTTVSMLAFWLLNRNVSGNWFFYLLMAWYYVLYMLDNMGFWGIAALLFDVRQSKRLFGVISAGDIPAKFVGYSLALIIVPFTGTKNLILIGACCMLASLPFFLAILKSGKHITPQQHKPHVSHENHRPKKIRKLVSNLVTNSYIRRIALISLITSCSVILFNYGLYGEVAKAYHEDVELATFIAFFYATIRIVAFITKMIFTSRLTLSLGVRSALFITPVGLVLMTTAIILAGTLSQDQKVIFYLFGISSIVIEVLRTSFNTPVLLTLMQPLPIHERLRAHNIVKGIMDPFASVLAGVALLLVYYFEKQVDLLFLCYGLLTLAAFWIVGVILVNRRYVNTLIKTISSRYFSRDEFDLNDDAVITELKKKMMKGSELEVISILNMLNSKSTDSVAEELIVKLLQHPSNRVKVEAIQVIASRNFTNARDSLLELIGTESHESVRTAAVKAYCRIGSEQWGILAYLADADPAIRYAAIAGMLTNSNEHLRKHAESALTHLLLLADDQEKKKGIAILNEVKDTYSHPAHDQLIAYSSDEISLMAMRAIGKATPTDTLRGLFRQVERFEKPVLEALRCAGEKSVPLIEELLAQGFISYHLQDKLTALLGSIGGEAAIQLLLKRLNDKTHIPAVVRALHRCKYSADTETQKDFEIIAKTYIAHGVELLHMQQALAKESKNYEVLNNSLYYEIQNIRELLLTLFGCMYDRQKMNQVKYGLSANSAESRANAMEIIEFTVRKDIARLFNRLFEGTTIEQRCESLRMLLTERDFEEVDEVLERILSEKPITYYNWTKACSLYISGKYEHQLDFAIFEKYAASENRLLRETALFADTKIPKTIHVTIRSEQAAVGREGSDIKIS